MAIISTVIDGKRHVANDDWTRCGKLIPFGSGWEQDPREGDPEGKLCKTCYATVEVEEGAKAEADEAKAEDAEPSQTLAQDDKAAKNKAGAKA
jgi:hypothetical protein